MKSTQKKNIPKPSKTKVKRRGLINMAGQKEKIAEDNKILYGDGSLNQTNNSLSRSRVLSGSGRGKK